MNGVRLATPGAVLFLVGVVLMYWGAGVFRDENGSLAGGITRRVMPTIPKPAATTPTGPGGGSGALRS